MKTTAIALALVGALYTPALMAQAKPKGAYAEANGLRYYYEIHGKGEPLLLLHGGLGSIDMFGPALPALAKSRRVIAVDLHGHGRTALGDRPISLPDIGDDLATVLKKIGVAQADVLGYSFGGGVAFRLAVQHPQMVRRLAMVSAGYAQDGFYAEMLPMQAQVGAAMAEHMKETPMYKSYMAVAPKKEDFPRLLDRMGELMRKPYDWSEDVKKLQMPVMIVFADSDMYRPEHIVKFYQLLGGGLKDAGWGRENMSKNRLAILPDLTHYDIFMSPELPRTVLPFLNGKSNTKNWK
jgi:pimeloyl-ACP methyl ester carboxylesterase